MAEMTVPAFVAKWSASRRTERAAAQEHFIDLCRLLGEQTPNEADPTGEDYAFEKGATKTAGSQGWADVWKRGRFAWEYKGPRANLRAAYQQLLQYREDLDNPPLLVVCDLDRFEVHTNFTGTAKRVYAFDLADLSASVATAASALPPLDVLRAVFTEPERLRPERTAEYVTEQAAAEFATLAESLRERGVDPERAAPLPDAVAVLPVCGGHRAAAAAAVHAAGGADAATAGGLPGAAAGTVRQDAGRGLLRD